MATGVPSNDRDRLTFRSDPTLDNTSSPLPVLATTRFQVCKQTASHGISTPSPPQFFFPQPDTIATPIPEHPRRDPPATCRATDSPLLAATAPSRVFGRADHPLRCRPRPRHLTLATLARWRRTCCGPVKGGIIKITYLIAAPLHPHNNWDFPAYTLRGIGLASMAQWCTNLAIFLGSVPRSMLPGFQGHAQRPR